MMEQCIVMKQLKIIKICYMHHLYSLSNPYHHTVEEAHDGKTI